MVAMTQLSWRARAARGGLVVVSLLCLGGLLATPVWADARDSFKQAMGRVEAGDCRG